MKTIVGILAISSIVFSCAKEKPAEQPAATASIDEAKTREVLDHHIKAFIENDMEAIMADYSEESILVTPDKTNRGLAEIRKGFEGAFALFPKDSSTLTLNKTLVAGDIGYMLWEVKAPKVELVYATDTFIIRDGKIIRQTYAGMPK